VRGSERLCRPACAGEAEPCRPQAASARRIVAARRARAALVVAALVLAALPAAADPAVPFGVRNLNPLTAIFGLPAWRAIGARTELAVTTEVANHYRFSRRGAETLILDGETWRTNLALSHVVGGRFRIGIEVPYYRQSGGRLDDLIDAWHSAFGLPDGGRNARPEDAIEYRLANAGGPFFTLDRPRGGAGDAQLSLAWRVGERRPYTVQAAVEVPTGDEALLAGSGGTDWSLTVFRANEATARARPGAWYWGVGAVRLEQPELIDFDARTAALVGILGGGWQIGRRFGLKAQLDFHGPLYDSRLEEIGKTAIQATFGGWVGLGRRGALELAVIEDVAVSTAPDVVLHAALRWTW